MADKPTPSTATSKQPGWEQDLISRLSLAAINEQRRARRWGIFFRFLLFAYLAALLIPLYMSVDTDIGGGDEDHTAVIKIDGIIGAKTEASADLIISALREAFEDDKTKGIVLRINSPGGSPVQAGYINDEILRLREKYPDIPLYAVLMDVCASGGYYIAAAADKIYADKASLVGSIGVRMDSFGLVGAIDKLGIERRLITAGEHKGFLDPFLPENPADVAHIRSLLDDIHRQFIDVVRTGRGDRLKETPELFSGYIWTGDQALALGLVDELGSTSMVARDVIGAKETKVFASEPDYLRRFIKRLGTEIRASLSEAFAGVELR